MTKSDNNFNSKISDATDISKPWDKDNQAWWDWYVSLADNDVKKDEIINAPIPYQIFQYQQMMRLFQS